MALRSPDGRLPRRSHAKNEPLLHNKTGLITSQHALLRLYYVQSCRLPRTAD